MRAIAFLGACLVFVLARPRLRDFIFRADTDGTRNARWLWVQVAGFLLILLPWTFVADGASGETMVLAFAVWIGGGALAALGTGFAVAPPGQWRKAARELGPVPLAVMAAAMLAPEITDLARGIWWIEPLTDTTFRAVQAILELVGVPAEAQPRDYVLRTAGFAIAVGSQCSGVEGFALITLFLLCYFYAFAGDLRFPHAWVLLPVGLVLSWMLNVVRIAVLFTIGSRVSPDLAVNGFHSHAGWLMFSALSLSVIGVSRTVPWFRRHRAEVSGHHPLRQDWLAACILPFAAFMAAALVLSTFTAMPGLWYVVKVVAMAGALALFLPLYARIDWRVDPMALAAGLAIGVLWIVVGSGGDAGGDPLAAALAALPAGLLTAWIVLRLVGTAVLVPVVEELFFRGYVLERLDRGGTALRVLALGVSTGLFALLHDRWELAAVAGLVYGCFYLRNRRIADAIVAHAASNVVIAAYALATPHWSLI